MEGQRQNNTFKLVREINYLYRMMYLEKLSFKNKGEIPFSDYQNK